MSRLAHYELLGRGAEKLAEFPKCIQKVDKNSILQTARKYFNPDAFTIGIVRGRAN
jgi:predicted Zn-dependent peptidase